MKNKGWVKFHREQFVNWISKKPFCDGYAWTYLYSQANHKKGMVNFRNEYIEVERGQLLTSKLKLQKIFGWTYRHVENFLLALKNDENIRYRTTNRYIVITVVNYEKYQGSDKQNGEQNGEQSKNRLGTEQEQIRNEATQTRRIKNDKNVNNEKKKKEISFDFSPGDTIIDKDDPSKEIEKKRFINLTKEKIEELNKKYPDVDINGVLINMENWLMEEKRKKDEGKKDKIPKNYNLFIHKWLRKEQDNGI